MHRTRRLPADTLVFQNDIVPPVERMLKKTPRVLSTCHILWEQG